ncbi:hypothetical protein [Halomicrococcus sp. SG-WS-1]|uniref:hypothetical protein n=1 Tax=Halomicrococcus sp. SG-WS-1 TaxID=3439057 RepID=UPI003F7B00CB
MGYEIGAIKYFLGMLTSVWGVMTAYLFAKGLFQPLDYVEGVLVVLNNLSDPREIAIGLLEIFITTPEDFAKLAIAGLAIMTLLWYFGSKFD